MNIASSSAMLRMLLVGAGFAAYGCEDLTSINENPNAPTNVETDFMATAAFVESLAFAEGTLNAGLLSHWVQHIARMQYDWDGRYDLEPGTMEGIWNEAYSGPLQDWTEIVGSASERGRPNQVAIATIMKAWLSQMVTDVWGDVPLSQANTGLIEGGTTVPVYDPQGEIYAALLVDLSQAAGMIDAGSSGFANVDFIYDDDLESWRRFANSLRLRLAIRLSEVNETTAADEFAAALAAGVFESMDDEATFVWEATAENDNPWCSNCPGLERSGGFKINATMVDTLVSLSDPRLATYARPNNQGQYLGMVSGLEDGHGIPFDARSNMGEYFVRQQQLPTILLGYDEVLFLRAEAAVRGWTAEDAASLYDAAIRASMARYDIATTDVNTYVGQADVQYDDARGLEQIWIQKWIALYTRGIEAFAEYRRTGVPSLAPAPRNVTGGVVPRRLPYPASEYSLNATQVEAAVERQSGASLTDRIWWDAR